MTKQSIESLSRLDSQDPKLGTQNEKGTGLGLMLCTEFIEKHQGFMQVESELGKSTVLSFTLPYNTEETV